MGTRLAVGFDIPTRLNPPTTLGLYNCHFATTKMKRMREGKMEGYVVIVIHIDNHLDM